MNRLACAEVIEQLELYAAAECDPAAEGLITSHLARCPDCTRAYALARELLGSLDLHYRAPEALGRLWERLDEEDRPRIRRLRIPSAMRPVIALAATLLVAVGLCTWLGPASPTEESGDARFVVLSSSAGARWEPINDHRLRLDSGEIRVQSRARGLAPATSVEVVTPDGVATMRGTDCFIGVRRPEASAQAAVAVTVLDGSVELANRKGTIVAQPRETVIAEAGDAPRKQVEDLARRFGQFYAPPQPSGPRVTPVFRLPLELDRVENWGQVRDNLGLEGDADRLRRNGFLVIPGKESTDMGVVYRDVRRRRIPVFVTADSALYASQLCLEETLAELEEHQLAPDLRSLLEALVAGIEDRARGAGADIEPARRTALLYLTVGLKALRPDVVLPREVDTVVTDVLGMIERHDSSARVPFLEQTEDFTEYQPRGHYTRSQALAHYFKAMTWFGRMTLLLPDGPGRGDGAKVQTWAAALITRVLAETTLPDGRKAWDMWARLDAISAFFVGLSDDLGVQQYRAALASVCGPTLRLELLSLDEKFEALRSGLARYDVPAILGGGGRGFHLLGKRFTLDGYAFGRLMAPAVGPGLRGDAFTAVRGGDGIVCRGFPRGLDLMALLGSGRAGAWLHEGGDDAYAAGDGAPGYDTARAALARQLANLRAADWNRNLYWSQLDGLRSLFTESGTGPLATAPAYQDRLLDAALASWVLARHAAILEAKPAGFMKLEMTPAPRAVRMTPAAANSAEGYVEPLPPLYARLLAQVRMARAGLDSMRALEPAAQARLAKLERLLAGLLAIAEQETQGQPLTAEQRTFLASFTDEMAGVLAAGGERPASEMAFVADVYAHEQSGQVLEEATGPVGLGLFVFPGAGGQFVLGAGPVLSYYEFKQPRTDRLTDEAWRRRLRGPTAPPRPAWAHGYLSTAGRYAPLPAE